MHAGEHPCGFCSVLIEAAERKRDEFVLGLKLQCFKGNRHFYSLFLYVVFYRLDSSAVKPGL